MRRTSLLTAVFSLVLAVLGPAAWAAGEGTVPVGVSQDPFTGAPPATNGGAERGGGFTFFGSGFGHGLGMSQWGSYGLALEGWDHARILKNFYRGTRVVKDQHPVAKLRVGITYDRTLIHLGARSGPVRLWIGKPKGNFVAKIPGGKTWTVRSSGKGYAIRDHTGDLVGGKVWGGRANDLFATYADTGSRVYVKEADAVSGVGYAYNRGFLEFNLYRGGGSWQERVIVPIAMEQYLLGIGEMPSSWPAQALETQAVAARTFATYTARNYGLRAYCKCDITDGANDQVYIGYNKEGGTDGKRWVHAVNATTRQIVTTQQGKVIQAFFAASDGGHSDAVEDVWHG
ncbi:MAG TPA: SpoIID/LytB domain-containing protein, partial [Actinomycetota bacterium]|nr:SpoIID/LytB domain-containing protein [Actinomycetota bacterium]